MAYSPVAMPFPALRSILPAAAAALALLFAPPSTAQNRTSPAASAAVATNDSWLYAGSDIPRDTAWQFGELPNGVRYAVRNNGVPPGQVSIRVRMDVGSFYGCRAERASVRTWYGRRQGWGDGPSCRIARVRWQPAGRRPAVYRG